MTGRVLVLDDDPVMLSTVRRILERAGHVVETFASPTAFLRSARLEPPCCVLLDLQMPEASGLEVQQALARAQSPAAVVFMSMHGDVPSAVQAMKTGALDFLPKPFEQEALRQAVAAALEKSAALAAARAARSSARERLARLSPRERQVAALLVKGMRNRAIGELLGVGEKTIKVHRARVQQKTGVGSVAELVQLMAAARREELG